MKLSKDAFIALTAVVWADGELARNEAIALLGAARACGLSEAEVKDVERATEQRGDLSALAGLDLSLETKEFIYGIASWLTRIDGVISPGETATLARLGTILGLSETECARAAVASYAMHRFEGTEAGAATDVATLALEIERAANEGDRITPV